MENSLIHLELRFDKTKFCPWLVYYAVACKSSSHFQNLRSSKQFPIRPTCSSKIKWLELKLNDTKLFVDITLCTPPQNNKQKENYLSTKKVLFTMVNAQNLVPLNCKTQEKHTFPEYIFFIIIFWPDTNITDYM